MGRQELILGGLLFGMLALGGASRADALSQAFERALAVATIAIVLWDRPARGAPNCRVLIYLLAAWTGLIGLQLIPLPPTLWTELPARDLLERFYATMGQPLPWRPISLEPHMTANSLFAMVVPWAALLLMTRKLGGNERLVELVLLSFLILTLVIGALQWASGGRSLYFYAITNLGSPVGLFSNRNHNSFVAAMIMPIVAHLLNRRSPFLHLTSVIIMATVCFVALINVLVIGSRMGLLLYAIGLATGILLMPKELGRQSGREADPKRALRIVLVVGVAAIATVAVATLVAFRNQFLAISRLTGIETEEGRLAYLPVIVELATKYVPFGSGFGTFPTVFKIEEPDSMLQLSYLNHAHNDVLEPIVEGGILAALLVFGFGVVWLWRAMSVWRRGTRIDYGLAQAKLGSVLSGLLLVGSITDYPLRTPACAIIFAIGCYWLFRPHSTPAVA